MIPPSLTPATSLVAVIDIQEKLIATLPDGGAGLLLSTQFLLDVARTLSVPIIVTEQYPKGLGPSATELVQTGDILLEKTCFSGCGAETFRERLSDLQPDTIIVLGMEAHVCVLQTVLDLLREGYRVVVAVDATVSALSLDADTAFRRLEQLGVTLATVESIAFEWLDDAQHEQFKTVSKRVIQFRQAKATRD